MVFVFSSTYSQDRESKQPVSVKLDIVGKGSPSICPNAGNSNFYFATINIQNTQDTALTFYVLTCSWALDGFIINNDSIAFRFCYGGCDSNIPEAITIPPKKSVQFYGTVKSWKKDMAIPRIKVGFKYFQTIDELWYLDGVSYKKILDKIVWSNEVDLKDNLYRYEIK